MAFTFAVSNLEALKNHGMIQLLLAKHVALCIANVQALKARVNVEILGYASQMWKEIGRYQQCCSSISYRANHTLTNMHFWMGGTNSSLPAKTPLVCLG